MSETLLSGCVGIGHLKKERKRADPTLILKSGFKSDTEPSVMFELPPSGSLYETPNSFLILRSDFERSL